MLRNMSVMTLHTSRSAVAERPRCKAVQFWPKVEDDIIGLSSTARRNRPEKLPN